MPVSYDFTLKTYNLLLDAILQSGYIVLTFKEFILKQYKPSDKIIIMRHDMDKRIKNSLNLAIIEKEKGIHSSYYFKYTRLEKDISVIKKIAALGHEIGYHYQELVLSGGNYENAIELFRNNLEEMRKIEEIKTICMDGNPLSKFDNRDLWKKYNYRDFGIIGEPYLDPDYSNILYLTDTGRAWNGKGSNVRDRVNSSLKMQYKSTFDIINSLKDKSFPSTALINVHPERWVDSGFWWAEEYVFQNARNLIKKFFLAR